MSAPPMTTSAAENATAGVPTETLLDDCGNIARIALSPKDPGASDDR